MATPRCDFDRIAADLVGMELSHLWRGHGSALFLECGTLAQRRRRDGSVGNPLGEISVGLEFAWRIEADGRGLCGSEGDRELWPEVFGRLRGRRISAVDLFGAVPEIRLVLDGGERLLAFALDKDGPEWALTDNRTSPASWVYWKDGALRSDDGKVA